MFNVQVKVDMEEIRNDFDESKEELIKLSSYVNELQIKYPFLKVNLDVEVDQDGAVEYIKDNTVFTLQKVGNKGCC